ncbi:MAG: glycosyltransferase [Armatimonadetes bacterium]|nr:glycosyltransferase [Armatimonadota bacterium]
MSGKILFVDQSGGMGGAEMGLQDIAAHFRARCSVLLLSDGIFRERLEARGVSVRVLEMPAAVRGVAREGKFSAGMSALPGLLRPVARGYSLARAHDVLYANTQKALVVACLLGAAARRPVIWHLRDILSLEHFQSWLIALAAFLGNRACARVIANSRATAGSFVRAGGWPDRLRVVYNGIDASEFEVAPAEIARDGKFLVGLFGRLAPWKGQHVLLEALALAPDVDAIVVGDALFGEDAYAAKIRRLADQSRVRLLGFRPDAYALVRACDAIVHTSVAPEPFGRVVVEGMLAGRPVVAAAAGGVPEIVEDGVSGLLVPPGDAAALAAALGRLRDDPALCKRLGEAGRRHAMAHFSLRAMLAGVESVVEEVLR